MVLAQTYGISRSHLNHRCQCCKVSIMLQNSRSPRSSMEGFCPWKEMLSISWFEQHKSLIWWETKRSRYKVLVQRQVNQEAMPVGTQWRLSGGWRLCSYRSNAFNTIMCSLERWWWNGIDHRFGTIAIMLSLTKVRGLETTDQSAYSIRLLLQVACDFYVRLIVPP